MESRTLHHPINLESNLARAQRVIVGPLWGFNQPSETWQATVEACDRRKAY